MKKTNTYTAILLAALLGLSAASCKYEQKKPESFVIMGDNSFERVIDQLIDVYEFQYPDNRALVRYDPEGDIINTFLDEKAQVIFAHRELTDGEVAKMKKKQHLVYQKKIAVDAIALIVNPANDLSVFNTLSMGELKEIFSGEAQDWDQVAPGNECGPIKIVFDNSMSSTVSYIRENVLDGAKFGDNVYRVDSIQGIFDYVAENKGAIGVLGVSWLSMDLDTRNFTTSEYEAFINKTDTVSGVDYNNLKKQDFKTVRVRLDNETEGFLPYQEDVRTGNYPLYRKMYIIATGTKGKHFFDFVTSPVGQKVILNSGVCPAFIYAKRVELTP